MASKLKAKSTKHRMPKNQYISLVMLLVLLATLVNLYYKPYLMDDDQPVQWLNSFVHPVSQPLCALQGFRCPDPDVMCDCDAFCANSDQLVPFRILEQDRVYVMNQKLAPGTYCLPKGAGQCNTQTSNHVFTLAGWSCLALNEDIFKHDKRKACQSDEAADNTLNRLYDFGKNEFASEPIEDYYERLPNSRELRYQCHCGSRSVDGVRMLSVFPFVCSVDYCLRDLDRPADSMGWDGNKCVCDPYFHLDPNDETSPCRQLKTRVEGDVLIGHVPCMTKKSFVKHALICPTDDRFVVIKSMMDGTNNPSNFIHRLIHGSIAP